VTETPERDTAPRRPHLSRLVFGDDLSGFGCVARQGRKQRHQQFIKGAVMKRYTLFTIVSSIGLFLPLRASASVECWTEVPRPSNSYGVLSVASNGVGGAATCVISAQPAAGDTQNNYIFKYNATSGAYNGNWDLMPNAARQITMSYGTSGNRTTGVPWVLRADGSIWKWNGSSFSQPSGFSGMCAKAIAVGIGDNAWVTSCNLGDDPAIYRWTGSAWAIPTEGGNAKYVGMFYEPQFGGGFTTPWAVQSNGDIYQLNPGVGWTNEGGGGGAITNNYVINVAENKRYQWNGSTWVANLAAPSGQTLIQLSEKWAIMSNNSTGFLSLWISLVYDNLNVCP
jgi:hypothetical protein